MNAIQTIEKGAMVKLGDTEALQSFKRGVDDLLLRRSYFISQVMPMLREGQDYFVLKGKKSLAKGGAEKLASVWGLVSRFEKDSETLACFPGVNGLVAYKCLLGRDNKIVGEGRGSAQLKDHQNNPNTTIKLAEKRAFVSAVIRTTGLSDIFTCDLEDNISTNNVSIEAENAKKEVPITDRQKELLTVLIKRHVYDDEEKSKWLQEIPAMSKSEGSDAISSFIGLR